MDFNKAYFLRQFDLFYEEVEEQDPISCNMIDLFLEYEEVGTLSDDAS